MVISEKLDQFFDQKMKEYPTQRSLLVPMLLYTQDELGCLTEEAIGLDRIDEARWAVYFGAQLLGQFTPHTGCIIELRDLPPSPLP